MSVPLSCQPAGKEPRATIVWTTGSGRLLARRLLARTLLARTLAGLLLVWLPVFCWAPQAAVAAEPVPVQFVLLPVEAINLPPDAAERYIKLLEQTIASNPRASLRRLPAVEQGEQAGCGNEMACLQRLGQRLQADRLLALRVGRLMDTVVVRLMVFDAQRGVRQGSWQEVLQKSDEQTIRQAMDRMAAGFLPPPPAPPDSWYTRWWVWGIAGAVVAGSVTATVLLTRGQEEPDWILRPW